MSEPGNGSTQGDPEAGRADDAADSDDSMERGLGRKIRKTVERRAMSSVRSQGAAYQGAMEAVLSILIATGLGYWVDQKLESAPIGIFIGVGLGFTAFVLRLTRMRKLLEPPESGDSGNGSGKNGSEKS